MNSVNITGRITKDPEIKYGQGGQGYLSFVLAVDRPMRDAQGNRQADFISCKAFGHSADFISKYVKKGNVLAIEGSISTGSYQNQQGETVYTTDVVVGRVENLSPREQTQQPTQQGYQQPYQAPQPQYQPQAAVPNQFTPEDNDLPF